MQNLDIYSLKWRRKIIANTGYIRIKKQTIMVNFRFLTSRNLVRETGKNTEKLGY